MPGAISVIAIASSGVLMMRFRKRWLAEIKIALTNQITSLLTRLAGFGILTHVGRESEKGRIICRGAITIMCNDDLGSAAARIVISNALVL
jgi:hypothetical protein